MVEPVEILLLPKGFDQKNRTKLGIEINPAIEESCAISSTTSSVNIFNKLLHYCLFIFSNWSAESYYLLHSFAISWRLFLWLVFLFLSDLLCFQLLCDLFRIAEVLVIQKGVSFSFPLLIFGHPMLLVNNSLFCVFKPGNLSFSCYFVHSQ